MVESSNDKLWQQGLGPTVSSDASVSEYFENCEPPLSPLRALAVCPEVRCCSSTSLACASVSDVIASVTNFLPAGRFPPLALRASDGLFPRLRLLSSDGRTAEFRRASSNSCRGAAIIFCAMLAKEGRVSAFRSQHSRTRCAK